MIETSNFKTPVKPFGLESLGFWYFVSRWTYKPFGLDISELSDCTESEDDDPEARKKRIER